MEKENEPGGALTDRSWSTSTFRDFLSSTSSWKHSSKLSLNCTQYSVIVNLHKNLGYDKLIKSSYRSRQVTKIWRKKKAHWGKNGELSNILYLNLESYIVARKGIISNSFTYASHWFPNKSSRSCRIYKFRLSVLACFRT